MVPEHIEFDFSEDALKRLEGMRRHGETRASVIRRALRTLEYCQQFADSTNVIVQEPGEDDVEITIGELIDAK